MPECRDKGERRWQNAAKGKRVYSNRFTAFAESFYLKSEG